MRNLEPFYCPGRKKDGRLCHHRLFDVELRDGTIEVRCPKCYTRSVLLAGQHNPPVPMTPPDPLLTTPSGQRSGG